MGLEGKSFISTQEFDPADVDALLARARLWKHQPPSLQPLAGRSVAMIFFNPSLRTRVTFDLAIRRLGGLPVILNVGTDSWTLEHRDGAVMDGGKTEHVKDAVRVLARFVQGIAVRSFPRLEDRAEDFSDAVVESFRRHSPVPVFNLESALYHPFQAMADLMTLQERLGALRGARVVLSWAPHPKPLPTAVPNSFLLAATQMGAEVTVVHPPQFDLDERIVGAARRNAEAAGARLRFMAEPAAAFRGAQAVYAKSWGAPAFYGRWEEEKRIREEHRDWIVDEAKMRGTASGILLHCLPVRRNVEVADEVLDGPRAAVYDEAENRLWVQMAVLEALLKGGARR